jgi:hypothetical protein
MFATELSYKEDLVLDVLPEAWGNLVTTSAALAADDLCSNEFHATL